MLDTIKIEGNGYLPLKDYKTWRIAQVSYDEKINSPEGFTSLGRHLETDEVFVILEGRALLITAGDEDNIGAFQYQKLQPGFLYTVKEKQWHVAILRPETRLLVIENQDTGIENSEQYNVTTEEKTMISKGIHEVL
jgi:mannose-6-phosphate isomerase-like protein (cupin superfamily)